MPESKDQCQDSIIIVSWNAQQYLRSCLHSVLPQLDADDSEVIVVDNASSDGSVQMLQQEFPQVRLLCNSDNFGFARANNIGIEHSRGRFLFLVNSDIEVLPDAFRCLRQHLCDHCEVGMVGPRVLNADRTLQHSCRRLPSLWRRFCEAFALEQVLPHSAYFAGEVMRDWEHDQHRQVEAVSGCFWAIRRQALEQVGCLDQSFFMYAEDIDLCRRLRDSNWQIAFEPQAQVIHYGGRSSARSPLRFYIERERANLQYWRKHASGSQAHAYLLLSCLYHINRTMGYGAAQWLNPRQRQDSRAKAERSIACLRWILGEGFNELQQPKSQA